MGNETARISPSMVMLLYAKFASFNALMAVVILVLSGAAYGGPLAWPIACVPGLTCTGSTFYLGYPDVNGSGRAFDCSKPGYTGHTGTDIIVSSISEGIAVLAAADGDVVAVSGGKRDHCTAEDSPAADCLHETAMIADPGAMCLVNDGCFSWGFDAGNFILIRHGAPPHQLYTLYAHLRRGSILVATGQQVRKGDKLAEVGNSGASLAPHLHFGVFARRPYGNDVIDPWQGPCSPQSHQSQWQHDPPYQAEVTLVKEGTGEGVITCNGGRVPCSVQPVSLIPGTSLVLKAVPYFGSRFAGWQGGCAGNGSTCILAAEGSIAVKAIFTREEGQP